MATPTNKGDKKWKKNKNEKNRFLKDGGFG